MAGVKMLILILPILMSLHLNICTTNTIIYIYLDPILNERILVSEVRWGSRTRDDARLPGMGACFVFTHPW